MSSRREGEHRITEQYREPLPYGSARGGIGIGQAAIPILIIFLVLFTATILGGWMFIHWLETDAWHTHPIAVCIFYAVCISPFAWMAYAAVDRHVEWKKDREAHRAVIYNQADALQLNAGRGFNTEVEGQLTTIRVINPVSLAQASKETNNYYGDGEEEDDDEEPILIEGPKVYNLIDQLETRVTEINEETSLVGYVDGEPLRGKLFNDDGNMFDSLFVIGDQGFGKSTLGVYLACLTLLHGGRIIVIDPDAEIKQSLTARLGPLVNAPFLLCPVADNPQKAFHAVKVARQEIENPTGKPVIWLIDEFSLLMRHATNGSGKWADVGAEIAELCEDWATRGRKRRCRVVAFGQISNAKRSAGTEFRDSCTVMAFHLKKDRALSVLELDEASLAPDLGAGEVIVVPARSSESSYRLTLPYPDEDGLNMVARIAGQSVPDAGSEKFRCGSASLDLPNFRPLNRVCPSNEPHLNGSVAIIDAEVGTNTEPFIVDPVSAFKAKIERIKDLRRQGKNQEQIIELVYGAKKGGTAAYAIARAEYMSIIKLLSGDEGEP